MENCWSGRLLHYGYGSSSFLLNYYESARMTAYFAFAAYGLPRGGPLAVGPPPEHRFHWQPPPWANRRFHLWWLRTQMAASISHQQTLLGVFVHCHCCVWLGSVFLCANGISVPKIGRLSSVLFYSLVDSKLKKM